MTSLLSILLAISFISGKWSLQERFMIYRKTVMYNLIPFISNIYSINRLDIRQYESYQHIVRPCEAFLDSLVLTKR